MLSSCILFVTHEHAQHLLNVYTSRPPSLLAAVNVAVFAQYYTRQAVYVKRNIEARCCNHCRSGKAISITYSVYVSVALVIQHAMRMRRIVICDLLRSTIFFPHCLINDIIFENQLLLFSRLYDVSTSSCAHLTIILSSSFMCLCHSILLPLIPFPPSVL